MVIFTSEGEKLLRKRFLCVMRLSMEELAIIIMVLVEFRTAYLISGLCSLLKREKEKAADLEG